MKEVKFVFTVDEAIEALMREGARQGRCPYGTYKNTEMKIYPNDEERYAVVTSTLKDTEQQ